MLDAGGGAKLEGAITIDRDGSGGRGGEDIPKLLELGWGGR
jgi:hypothetical protein